MMLKKILFIILVGGLFLTIRGEETPEADILASPSYWGMARSGGALRDMSDQVWINPSLIPESFHYAFSANLGLMPADIRVSQLTGRYQFGKHVISGGINHENYGEFERLDTEGYADGEFIAGRTQYFTAWSYGLSSKMQVGVSFRYLTDVIGNSREAFGVQSYGITIIPIKDKTRLSLAYTDYPDLMSDEIRFSLSHPLLYLPLTMNVDYRYRGSHTLENLTLGGYFRSDSPLEFLAGLDFRRGGLQTNTLGQDYIAGLAFGGRYRYKEMVLQLSAFSYGGLGTVTTFGVSYHHGS